MCCTHNPRSGITRGLPSDSQASLLGGLQVSERAPQKPRWVAPQEQHWRLSSGLHMYTSAHTQAYTYTELRMSSLHTFVMNEQQNKLDNVWGRYLEPSGHNDFLPDVSLHSSSRSLPGVPSQVLTLASHLPGLPYLLAVTNPSPSAVFLLQF